jgi:hypothetical protein
MEPTPLGPAILLSMGRKRASAASLSANLKLVVIITAKKAGKRGLTERE